jgi:hypothetical protein
VFPYHTVLAGNTMLNQNSMARKPFKSNYKVSETKTNFHTQNQFLGTYLLISRVNTLSNLSSAPEKLFVPGFGLFFYLSFCTLPQNKKVE